MRKKKKNDDEPQDGNLKGYFRVEKFPDGSSMGIKKLQPWEMPDRYDKLRVLMPNGNIAIDEYSVYHSCKNPISLLFEDLRSGQMTMERFKLDQASIWQRYVEKIKEAEIRKIQEKAELHIASIENTDYNKAFPVPIKTEK